MMQKLAGKTVFNYIILIGSLVSSPLSANVRTNPISRPSSLLPNMLRFEYYTFDGEKNIPCSHQLKDADAQDWSVKCGNEKNFIVHLWITAYPHDQAANSTSKMSYEILYWVTDFSQPGHPIGSSSTLWLNLKQKSELDTMQFTQSVDQDAAGLRLSFTPAIASVTKLTRFDSSSRK